LGSEYDRETKDLLVLQSEIAGEIAAEIQAALGEHKPVSPILEPTLSPQAFEAYNLYLKGQYFWNKRSLLEATSYFEQATAKDPNFARAYAGLADCYALIGAYTGLRPPNLRPRRAPPRCVLCNWMTDCRSPRRAGSDRPKL